MTKQRRRNSVYLLVHLLGKRTDFPLSAIAAAQAEKVLEAAGVRRHDNAGRAGIRQNVACVLNGVLFSLAAGSLLRNTLLEQLLEVAFHQHGRQFLVGALVVLHRLNEFCPGSRNFINLRRNNILKALLTHITLALYRERCNAVARDLRQQRTRYTLDCKGERHMLDRAFVADLGKHVDKALGLFLGQTIQHAVHVRGGIAVLCCSRDQLFRVRRVSKQFDFHSYHFPFLPKSRSLITMSRNFGSFIIRPMRLGCLSRR